MEGVDGRQRKLVSRKLGCSPHSCRGDMSESPQRGSVGKCNPHFFTGGCNGSIGGTFDENDEVEVYPGKLSTILRYLKATIPCDSQGQKYQLFNARVKNKTQTRDTKSSQTYEQTKKEPPIWSAFLPSAPTLDPCTSSQYAASSNVRPSISGAASRQWY